MELSDNCSLQRCTSVLLTNVVVEVECQFYKSEVGSKFQESIWLLLSVIFLKLINAFFEHFALLKFE